MPLLGKILRSFGWFPARCLVFVFLSPCPQRALVAALDLLFLLAPPSPSPSAPASPAAAAAKPASAPTAAHGSHSSTNLTAPWARRRPLPRAAENKLGAAALVVQPLHLRLFWLGTVLVPRRPDARRGAYCNATRVEGAALAAAWQGPDAQGQPQPPDAAHGLGSGAARRRWMDPAGWGPSALMLL
uniref:Uncharacterized protein n=1 Tax=Setaria viridis TaxID=4556 RepID=A0A4U6WHE7_SETVI|nr:hypothetical protein SEVIR_1G044400v2 [Setaria viridis]